MKGFSNDQSRRYRRRYHRHHHRLCVAGSWREVTIIDRNRYAAMEASFANGGQLSPCNAEVWNSFGTIMKGMKWMFRKDAPLLLNPKPSCHKYSWLAEFTANIGNYRQNTIRTMQLAISARQHLFDIAEREGIDFDLQRRGILHVYRDAVGFAQASRTNVLLQEGGLERHAVTPAEIRGIEPSLRGDFFGGFFTPSDSIGDIHKFCRGLADACPRRCANFVSDATVTNIRPASGGVDIGWQMSGGAQSSHADAVVICAGIASRHFGGMLGDRLNIYPVKGYSITVGMDDAGTQAAAPWVSLLDEQAKIVTSQLGANRLRVAGTAEYNGANRDIRADRIRPLVDWTSQLFPGVNTYQVTPWAGLRSMMPRVQPGKQPGAFYNTGHRHLGWTLSAATAQMVADQVLAAPAGVAKSISSALRKPALAVA